MSMRSMFRDVGAKLGLCDQPTVNMMVDDSEDPTPMLTELLGGQGFKSPGTAEAAEALVAYFNLNGDEAYLTGGCDFFKKPDGKSYDIIGIACVTTKEKPNGHYAVQVDLSSDSVMTPPKFVALDTFCAAMKAGHDADAFFAALPRATVAPRSPVPEQQLVVTG